MNLLKIKFIRNFIKQRNLKVEFKIINLENNSDTKALEWKRLRPKTKSYSVRSLNCNYKFN